MPSPQPSQLRNTLKSKTAKGNDMLTRRIFMIAASTLALAASTAFASADVIKLGVLAPLTGPAAADGQEMANGVKLAVEDSGPGIEPKHLPRLFERFYRVDKGRARDVGGTGLGLSIVKHLVEAMGGEVGVDSQVGKGSTFWALLPRSEAAHVSVPAVSVDTGT